MGIETPLDRKTRRVSRSSVRLAVPDLRHEHRPLTGERIDFVHVGEPRDGPQPRAAGAGGRVAVLERALQIFDARSLVEGQYLDSRAPAGVQGTQNHLPPACVLQQVPRRLRHHQRHIAAGGLVKRQFRRQLQGRTPHASRIGGFQDSNADVRQKFEPISSGLLPSGYGYPGAFSRFRAKLELVGKSFGAAQTQPQPRPRGVAVFHR